MITWIHILYLLLILYNLYVNAGTYLSKSGRKSSPYWKQAVQHRLTGCSALSSHASATFTDRLFSTIASDASRQKIIFLREAHGQGFGVAHLGFEQFLEARHKIFRRSSFDDFSNLRCKTNGPESCQRSGSRQNHVYDEPFDCLATPLREEPICYHARVCRGSLHRIQRHCWSWHQWELLSLHIDILA